MLVTITIPAMKPYFELAQAASVGGNQVDWGHPNHQMKASQSFLFPHGSAMPVQFSLLHMMGEICQYGFSSVHYEPKLSLCFLLPYKQTTMTPEDSGKSKRSMKASENACPCKMAGFCLHWQVLFLTPHISSGLSLSIWGHVSNFT